MPRKYIQPAIFALQSVDDPTRYFYTDEDLENFKKTTRQQFGETIGKTLSGEWENRDFRKVRITRAQYNAPNFIFSLNKKDFTDDELYKLENAKMEASYGRLQGSDAIKVDLQTLADNVEYKPLPGEISSAFNLVEPSSDDEQHEIT